MFLKTNEKLSKWEFLDVKISGNNVSFYKGDIKVGETEANLRKYPKNIKTKAIVTNFDEEKDLTNIEIISFVDIHRHSGYSLLDGGITIKKLVEKTEFVGALTDHGNMFGLLDYYKQMLKADKKPILGFEAYCENFNGSKEKNHLVLIAKTNEGFKNLIKLTSEAYYNFYSKPHVSYEMLEKYGKGIIATSACIGGEIPKLLLKDKYDEAVIVAKRLKSFFDEGDFYIEIQRHGLENEEKINNLLIKLARELNIPLVAAIDSHYVNKEDSLEHEVLLCIGVKTTMSDEERMKFEGTNYHLFSSKEAEELFKDIPEAISNTLEIAEKCNVELDLKTVYMPKFDVPAPFKDEEAYFVHLTKEGFKKRFGDGFDDEEYKARLVFEMGIINKMEFPGYFLIVEDFVSYAKRKGILVGPGRGSVCGSLVAYCLGITNIDPIKYGLLFERFLNVDRISMPDIDMDFEDNRREEVIDYVKSKYGADAVSRIITFGTLTARAAVRDVARVLDYPNSLSDKISKSINSKLTLSENLTETIEFSNLYNESSDVKKIVDIARKLEGLPRNASSHACGIVISPSAVTNYIPQVLMEADNGLLEPTTQFTMTECEEMGLLKMDFLGLRTMGAVSRCLIDVNKKREKEGLEPIDYPSIPIDDPAVFEYISNGNTHGVFQLESQGMTTFMKELFQDAYKYKTMDEKSTKNFGEELFERLIAGISLYRPGPIDGVTCC